MGNKRKTEDVLSAKLSAQGEAFMAMFDDYEPHSKKPCKETVETSKSKKKGESNLECLEEESGDSQSESSGLGASQQDDGFGSDSGDSLEFPINFGKAKIEKKVQVDNRDGNLARLEKKAFMSGKVNKIHSKVKVDKPRKKALNVNEDDEGFRRDFFKAKRDVEHFGVKGMEKGGHKKLSEKEWVRLGGRAPRGHRIPKSVGHQMYREKLAQEKAAKLEADTTGLVLNQPLKLLQKQKRKQKEQRMKRVNKRF